MRILGMVCLCVAASGCAFPKQVERFGVEYNAALAGMSNEQTLLNILRAKDGMPTHFSSVKQFRGNLSLTAAAQTNAQLRGEGLTQTILGGFSNTTATTASTTTTVPAGGGAPSVATVASTVATPVTSGSTTTAIAEGVDLYTPQVSGQIVSGTNFDVDVFDSQKFYQGITASIPLATIEALLAQGFDNRVIAALTIARVEFRLPEASGGMEKGVTILRFINDPADPAEAAKFARFVNCYELGSGSLPPKVENLVAVSRLTRGPDGKTNPLPLDKVILIDGEKIGVTDGGIGDPANDDKIYLTRITGAKRVARLSRRAPDNCVSPGYAVSNVKLNSGSVIQFVLPQNPNIASDPVYSGDGFILKLVGRDLQQIPVTMEITFRSPEGLFRYLGTYLANNGGVVLPVAGQPLFSLVDRKIEGALAQARYRGQTYSLINSQGTGTRNAQIFTLLQQLINLHKEASDRPTVIPVRAIP